MLASAKLRKLNAARPYGGSLLATIENMAGGDSCTSSDALHSQ